MKLDLTGYKTIYALKTGKPMQVRKMGPDGLREYPVYVVSYDSDGNRKWLVDNLVSTGRTGVTIRRTKASSAVSEQLEAFVAAHEVKP